VVGISGAKNTFLTPEGGFLEISSSKTWHHARINLDPLYPDAGLPNCDA
jgi:hypothetical protein